MSPRRFFLLALVLALALTGCELAGGDGVETTTQTETVVPIPEGPDVTIDGDAAEQGSPDIHEGAKDETPAGVTPDEAEQVLEPVAGIGPPKAVGGAQLLSCPKKLVRNHSSRGTAKVATVFYHYTVSAPGTLRAIWNLFNTASFEASSHILLEPSGECEQIVEYGRKAWTQGAFNPIAVSVEIVCCRSDPPRSWWLAQPIIKKGLLAAWTVDRLKQFGLPPRRVDLEGCNAKAGYTDHNAAECGNDHTDVGRGFPWDVVGRQISALFNSGSLTKLVWQARSGGNVLFQQQAVSVGGVGGYDRLLAILRGRGEAKVRAAEKANGDVRIVLVQILA